MTDIANSIRAEFAAIRRRYEGNTMAAVKIETVEKAVAHIEALEDQISNCTCGASHEGFEIDVRRTQRGLDAMFNICRLKRMAMEDAAVTP